MHFIDSYLTWFIILYTGLLYNSKQGHRKIYAKTDLFVSYDIVVRIASKKSKRMLKTLGISRISNIKKRDKR